MDAQAVQDLPSAYAPKAYFHIVELTCFLNSMPSFFFIFLHRSLMTSQVIIDNDGHLTVGAIYPGQDQFSGYLQDVRVYSRKLTDV